MGTLDREIFGMLIRRQSSLFAKSGYGKKHFIHHV